MRKAKDETYSIGQLADKTRCRAETIRYYERIGLMRDPPRTAGGRRYYSLADLKRLSFVRRSRELGFNIDQVRGLLRLIDEPRHTCGEVKALTLAHDRDVLEKIEDLQRLHAVLTELASGCKGRGHSIEDCAIVDALCHVEA